MAKLITLDEYYEVVAGIQLSGSILEKDEGLGDFDITWAFVSKVLNKDGKIEEFDSVHYNMPLHQALVRHCITLATRYGIDILDTFKTRTYLDTVVGRAMEIVERWGEIQVTWTSPYADTIIEEIIVPAVDELIQIQEDLQSAGFNT